MKLPCPYLPAVDVAHDCSITRKHGSARGEAFYLDALRYAQSQWLANKPAQAILQLNKAWLADLSPESMMLSENPPPYFAMVWIMQEAQDESYGFLGNPVRHFQHLASRMSGPRAHIRKWRAWYCYYLADAMLPRDAYPRDVTQRMREGLWIPTLERVHREVEIGGWDGEASIARSAYESIVRRSINPLLLKGR